MQQHQKSLIKAMLDITVFPRLIDLLTYISLNPFFDCEKQYKLHFVGNAYSKTTADIQAN